MDRPEYDDLVEPWKVALLVARAVRMGFAGEDLKDALQDIMPIVVAFKFELAKSNGAKESTALTALIDNQLRMILRKRARGTSGFARCSTRRAGRPALPR